MQQVVQHPEVAKRAAGFNAPKEACGGGVPRIRQNLGCGRVKHHDMNKVLPREGMDITSPI